MGHRLTMLAGRVRAFLRSKRGNVAMMFGLAIVPLMIAAGVGLDLTRAMLVRQQMGEALDAAALALGSTSGGLTQAQANSLAQSYFSANYQVDQSSFGTPTLAAFTWTPGSGTVQLSATDNMPTVLMKIAGINNMSVNASSTVVWGQSKLWVALVLDNSGSMANGDSGGSKMAALQNASNQLLTILKNASATPGDVQASIVPFVSDVNVGTSNASASWLDFSQDWSQPPLTNASTNTHQQDTDTMPVGGDPLDSFGPGDKCPYDGSRGYKCAPTPVNDTHCYTGSGSDDCIANIPSSGTYKGYICPSMHIGGTTTDGMGYHFYNGCWEQTTSSGTVTVSSCTNHPGGNCSCSSGTCTTKKWPHTWVANSTSTWDGCVWDRQQNYDESNATPSSGGTMFVPENMLYCGTATVTPLGYDWTNLTTQINAMSPYGATNQAIGIAHGWQTITPGAPYGAPSVPTNTARYIILLSDGQNTMDRWYGNGSTERSTPDASIDAREEATCDAAKADGVIIYTILLDIPAGSESPSAPLSYCASDSSKYFVLTSTTAIVTTFNQIAQQITDVRVSH
ncbi:MAG TPA: TadE/TadG family type IV pilus assembly protein [Rhizomicrobium sp.]